MGVGNERSDSPASTRVKTNSSAAVKQAVLSVFQEQGFRLLSQTSQSATFSKVGGRSADATWSTIGNPNPVMIRPYVAWRASSATEMFVTCDVEVAQESTVFGENTRQPTWLGSSAYNSLLKDVKRRVEKGE